MDDASIQDVLDVADVDMVVADVVDEAVAVQPGL